MTAKQKIIQNIQNKERSQWDDCKTENYPKQTEIEWHMLGWYRVRKKEDAVWVMDFGGFELVLVQGLGIILWIRDTALFSGSMTVV